MMYDMRSVYNISDIHMALDIVHQQDENDIAQNQEMYAKDQ